MKKSLACFIGLLVGLFAAETIVHLYLPQPPFSQAGLNRGAFTSPGVYPHKTSEFSVQVKVNKHGFVDSEWTPKSKRRTLLIGDSFVQGAQVELNEGLGRRLQSLLPDEEIISIGVPGAGTTTAMELAKKYALDLEADTVILCFLPSNDIMNNHFALDGKPNKPYRQLESGTLLPPQDRAQKDYSIFKHSHLFRYAIRQYQKQAFTSKQTLNREYPKMFEVHLDEQDEVWEEAWRITELILDEFSRWSQENNVRFGIALIPSQYEVSPSHWRLMQKKWPKLGDLSLTGLYTRAYKMCSNNSSTLDLYPPFRIDADKYYYPLDGHWTPSGHDYAAKLMLPFINEINTPIQEMVK